MENLSQDSFAASCRGVARAKVAFPESIWRLTPVIFFRGAHAPGRWSDADGDLLLSGTKLEPWKALNNFIVSMNTAPSKRGQN